VLEDGENEDDGLFYQHIKERPRTPPKPGEKPPEPKLPPCPKAASMLFADDVYASGKAMRPTKGQKLPYNAFLRSKLVGVLGPVMLKLNSPWRRAYDNYKHRKQCAGWGRSDAHRHQAAIRYMIKMLILDVWLKFREYHKLSVRPSYQEEKLGHKHDTDILARFAPVEAAEEEEVSEEVELEAEMAAAAPLGEPVLGDDAEDPRDG
jgi:hypothetical protein